MKKLLLLKSLLFLCALLVGSSAWATDYSFDFSTTGSYNSTEKTITWTDSYCSILQAKGSSTTDVNSSYVATPRWYKNHNVTFTPTSGYSISQIVLVGTIDGKNTYYGQTMTASKGTVTNTSESTTTWTGTATNAAGVTLTMGSQFRPSSVTITYSVSGVPSISLSPSNINATKAEVDDGSITVTYNNIDAIDAEVLFYESDGETATTYDWMDADIDASNNVEYVISANPSATRKAYIKVHEKNENVYSSLITITQAAGLDAPSFSPAAGTVTPGTAVTLTQASADAIRYTLDGSEPTKTTGTVYSDPIEITSSKTIKAIAVKGENVSDVATATYTIIVAKPTILVVGSMITMSAADGCSIYYTTNNSEPTSASTKYTGSFDVGESNCTIKAIAYDSYDNASYVTTVNYKYMALNPKNINSGYYEKVTDASSLEDGDAILIVNETAGKALSTNQKDSNRGTATITLSDSKSYAPSADVQKLVLVKKTEKVNDVDTDVFYFFTGNGYLYASSSTANQLKTEMLPDNNGNARATITFDSNNAVVTFKGTNTRNLMQYNSGGDGLFNCYASASQSAIQIYKEVAHNEAITPGYANITYVTPYKMNFASVDGLKAYVATAAAAGNVTMTRVEEAVPENTPLLLMGTAGTTYNVPVVASATAPETNFLRKGDGTTVFDGTTYDYILYSDGKFYQIGSGTVATNKAYLHLDAAPSGARSLDIVFNDDETTGVNMVQNSKVMVNGYYDLQGRKVANPTKGLYIVNGKKVIIK